MTISYEALMTAIGEVAQAERITKSKLSTLSRELLTYTSESEDIRPINALMGLSDDGNFVLTPMNWRTAAQYFNYFLPFSSNFDDVKDYVTKGKGNREALVFGKKQKRKFDAKMELINEFLSDENNDIWVWSDNLKVEGAPKDWRVELQKVLANATGQGKAKQQGDMTTADVLGAMMEVEGFDMAHVLDAMNQLTRQDDAA